MSKNTKKIKKTKVEVKEELKEGVLFNGPNIISILRLLLAFFFIYMIISDFSRISIAVVFAIAALTDALDGFIARKFDQTSVVGARLDQVVDRIFTGIVVIGLVIYFLMYNLDNEFIIMVFLSSSREIIGLPGVFVRFIGDKDFYEVRYIGKITNWVQGIAVTSIIAGFSFSIYLAVIACIIGIYSGFDYLKRSFK